MKEKDEKKQVESVEKKEALKDEKLKDVNGGRRGDRFQTGVEMKELM